MCPGRDAPPRLGALVVLVAGAWLGGADRRVPLGLVTRAAPGLPERTRRQRPRSGGLVARPATIGPRGRTSITDMRRPRPLEIPEGFLRVCVLACRRRRAPSRADRHGTDLTSAEGKLPASAGSPDGGVRAVVFGLLLFLWLAFGGPIRSRRRATGSTRSSREASSWPAEADVRISGVGRKVSDDRAGRRRPAARVTMSSTAVRAARRRTRAAILRQKTLLGEN